MASKALQIYHYGDLEIYYSYQREWVQQIARLSGLGQGGSSCSVCIFLKRKKRVEDRHNSGDGGLQDCLNSNACSYTYPLLHASIQSHYWRKCPFCYFRRNKFVSELVLHWQKPFGVFDKMIKLKTQSACTLEEVNWMLKILIDNCLKVYFHLKWANCESYYGIIRVSQQFWENLLNFIWWHLRYLFHHQTCLSVILHLLKYGYRW
jgi:hypothetical protein